MLIMTMTNPWFPCPSDNNLQVHGRGAREVRNPIAVSSLSPNLTSDKLGGYRVPKRTLPTISP
jgi:hypothetical protein